MDKQSERNESKLFISNMVESAIRIGLIFVLLMFTYDIIRPFILPVIWGAIIAVALLPLTKNCNALTAADAAWLPRQSHCWVSPCW